MPQAINIVVVSRHAQRSLSIAQGGLAAALESLSSCLRLNGAIDDVAGGAICERCITQIHDLNQTLRSPNDGISLTFPTLGARASAAEIPHQFPQLSVHVVTSEALRLLRQAAP